MGKDKKDKKSTEDAKALKKLKKSEKKAAKAEKKDKSEKKDRKGKKDKKPSSSGSSFIPLADAKKWCEDNVVVISGKNRDAVLSKIAASFAILEEPSLVAKGEKLGWTPSAIQAASWATILEGEDLVAIAETGSGKTLGFGLPCLALLKSRGMIGSKKPKMIILAPTRELAQQSHEVLVEWGKPMGYTSTLVVGGTNRSMQVKDLARNKYTAVVGTPGRMIDLMNDGHIDGSEIEFAVLDEADRMLDKGFLQVVKEIFAHCPDKRQNIMFSATWPDEVQKLTKELLNNPRQVFVGFEDACIDEDGDVATTGEKSTNDRIVQKIEVIDEFKRLDRMKELMKGFVNHTSKGNRVLIFVLYKKEAPRVEQVLQREGYQCASIHGDKSQPEREKVLADFKANKIPIMIATDVAARGLDIPDVEVVFNFSFPLTIEDYIHRIGRTGRAGKTGHAHTFFTQLNKDLAGELQAVLRSVGQEDEITPELAAFGGFIKRKKHPIYGDIGPQDGRPMRKAVHIKFD